jgi:hypothetical protein
MNQSPATSLIEATAGAVAGYLIAIATQFAVFPVFGLAVVMIQNLGIGVVFTVASIVRSYALRRLFERLRRARP